MTAALRAFPGFVSARFDVAALTADVFRDNPVPARVPRKAGLLRRGAGTGISAQRLEPAPVWRYRLCREAFRA